MIASAPASSPPSPADAAPVPRLGWPEVFLDNYSFVHSVSRRLAGPELDTEDLTQEVFVVVHRRLHTLRDPQRLRSWLYSICRRVVAQQRRKHKVLSALRQVTGQQPEDGPTPEQRSEAAEVERRLYATLDQLSAKRREVLILYALEELEGKQIAELLDLPLNTVWTRLHEARKDLAARLKKQGIDSISCLREKQWSN